MSKLFIANTSFEWELSQKTIPSLEDIFESHPGFLQLQFIPFLYAERCDGVVVTRPPYEGYWLALKNLGIQPAQQLLFSETDFSKFKEVDVWGHSRALHRWAKERNLVYALPDWNTVLKVNSKAFSWEISPKLPGSQLLYNIHDAKIWLSHQKGQVVFKKIYGFSGRDHFLIDLCRQYSIKDLLIFLEKEWEKNHPILAEPWQKRYVDFSTQWKIDAPEKIEYLGATICKNSFRGGYQASYAGQPNILFQKHTPFLLEHQNVALPVIQKIAELGYFGHVGVDAMIYHCPLDPSKLKLHPIVEINARKTMGWLSLEVQKRLYPSEIISLQFSSCNAKLNSLLPLSIPYKNGRALKFPKSLFVQIEDNLNPFQLNLNQKC